MSKICFVDNDIFLKLLACNLFYETISLLALDTKDLRFLDTAKYVIKGNRRLQKQYSSNILDDAINIINQCVLINPQNKYETDVKFLVSEDSIDIGEARLLAATSVESDFFLMTGDKNCLRTLANAPRLDIFYQRVKGKVICLELLIYKLIKEQDFKLILEKILPARDYDKTLKRCFGSGNKAEEQIVLGNLEQEIQIIQRDTKNILVDFS